MNETKILIIYDNCQGDIILYAVPPYHPDITVLRSCHILYAGCDDMTEEQLEALDKLDNDDECEIYENDKYLVSGVIVTGWVP